jgi:superfamily I DNA/RNA helicase
VDEFWRGVVVRLGNARYALLRVLAHDAATEWAKRQRFEINPVTGIVEIIDIPTVAEHVEAVVAATPSDEPAGLFADRRDRDFTAVGVDADLVPILRKITTEDELYSIANFLPAAQADAVLLLADGMTVEGVWEKIQADYAVAADEPVDTDDIDAALDRPASRAAFAVTTNDSELLDLLTGDFEAWRTFLHPTQRMLAERPVYNGPVKITGGAGTGKTVVLMHRARFLAQQLVGDGDGAKRLLVATYTRSLAANLDRTLRTFCTPEQHRSLRVSTVDALGQQVLASTQHRLRPVQADELDELARDAVLMSGLDELNLDHRFLIAEWEQVVLARDINTPPEYAMAPRPGRGVRLSRAQRKQVWSAIERLVTDLATRKRATYVQLADLAAEQLAARAADAGLFAHAVIDEAQDLHPAQWRLLRACVPPGPNDLFLAGDAHQRIYDHKVSLSSLGIETRGRSRRLKINYRTSQSILAHAQGILRGVAVDDLDGEIEQVVGYRSAFDGPPPTTERFVTPSEEAEYVARTVRGWIDEHVSPSAIGVLARTRQLVRPVQEALTRDGIVWGELDDDAAGNVRVTTMHSAKGMEFARLVVVGLNADAVPLPIAVTAEADDALQHEHDVLRERCLLYVACTRARDLLVLTGSGPASTLLPAAR